MWFYYILNQVNHNLNKMNLPFFTACGFITQQVESFKETVDVSEEDGGGFWPKKKSISYKIKYLVLQIQNHDNVMYIIYNNNIKNFII